MSFELMPLPFSRAALSTRGMCAETLELHHDQHHQAYVDQLNELLKIHPDLQGKSLEQLVRETHGKPKLEAVFNNAGQAWNHDLFWDSVSATGGGLPGALDAKLREDFGGIEQYKAQFKKIAADQFGSGWVWLVLNGRGRLNILSTANAVSPLATGEGLALLVLDVWEHAYYLDYRNRRRDFTHNFLTRLANYEAAAARLKRA